MPKGFTLVELIVVLIVIGILTTFAVPQFAVTKERALDREVISTLGIIRAAERAYRMEESAFYPASGTTSDINTINTTLRLSLPFVSPSWTYSVGGISTATRTAGSRIRIWSMDAANDDEVAALSCSGSCL